MSQYLYFCTSQAGYGVPFPRSTLSPICSNIPRTHLLACAWGSRKKGQRRAFMAIKALSTDCASLASPQMPQFRTSKSVASVARSEKERDTFSAWRVTTVWHCAGKKKKEKKGSFSTYAEKRCRNCAFKGPTYIYILLMYVLLIYILVCTAKKIEYLLRKALPELRVQGPCVRHPRGAERGKTLLRQQSACALMYVCVGIS